MEIRRVLRGENAGFSAARPAEKTEKTIASARSTTDRVELSRQWIDQMQEQSAQLRALLTQSRETKEKKSEGILDMLDSSSAEEQELDALSEQMKAQMKCLQIAMNIMKGKKVPPEDERYLMENDPNGYKIAIAMKVLVKEDDEECESVLDEEDRGSGETAETGEAAPAEGGGDAPSSGGGESAV